MNLLGRLFIVLIFIGSIMLASFAVTLFATHTNWREQFNRTNAALTSRTQELAELQAQKAMMEAALRLEINNQASRNIALADRVRQLTQDNETARDDIAELREDLAVQVAAVEAAHETTARLRERFDGQSTALNAAQTEWVAIATELVKKTDEAHALSVQVTNYQTTAAKLAEDYRSAVEVLRIHNLQPNPALYAKRPPAGIEGLVTEVRPGGWVEISLGSDSGLAKGHQLDVVRTRDGRSVYIGKIEIADPAADRASARIMPEFRLGVVQRGDTVTYIELNEHLAAH